MKYYQLSIETHLQITFPFRQNFIVKLSCDTLFAGCIQTLDLVSFEIIFDKLLQIV